MHFSPSDLNEIKNIAAKLIVDEIRGLAGGDLASVIVIPANTAGQFVGYTGKQLKSRVPITKIGTGKDGVTLRNLMDHISSNTTPPRPS
jgi:hypothetical protein